MEDKKDQIVPAIPVTAELPVIPLSQVVPEMLTVPVTTEIPAVLVKQSVTFRAHVRRLFTDGRDLSFNVTLTIFDNQNLDGLVALRDQSVEVALIKLPEFP